ncbi:MAG: hypothetical protein CM15mP25_3700 [Gammaproteobacteria bacterium]|nr:MAG: hypothetical protein CM15mP25_3700 [Gammaproteobacteria bacterium]
MLLESDKASMEVPAPAAGTVTAWLLEAGTTVKEGAVIARLAIEGAPAASTQSDGGRGAAQSEPRPLAEERQESQEDAQTNAGIAPTAVADRGCPPSDGSVGSCAICVTCVARCRKCRWSKRCRTFRKRRCVVRS